MERPKTERKLMDALRITRILTGTATGILLGVLSGCTPSIAQQTSTEPPTIISFTATEPLVVSAITDTPQPSVTKTPLPSRPAPVITPFTDATLPFQAFPVAEEQLIALVNGRVIDGTGAPARLGWTVLIQGRRILAAGSNVEIPAEAHV